jgi:hypothetical protein
METKIKVRLDKDAIDLMERIIDKHRPQKGDSDDMRKLYTRDRRDLRLVLSWYKIGKWEAAGELAQGLDTAVREMIPDPIWNSITKDR